MDKFSNKIPVWLDCDPGHDDAFAILLAGYSEEINLLGISIVNGNDEVENCRKNALRFLWTCGILNVEVYSGVERPLIRDSKYCPEIHGIEGDAGVAGMCGYKFPDHLIFPGGYQKPQDDENGILKIYEKIKNFGQKVTVVCTGAHTNLALLLRVFPDVKDKIKEIVFMGGSIGLGNTSIAAEFNIEIDPEASYILLHSGIPIVMVPLELTHSNLVTDEIFQQIAHIEQWTSHKIDQILPKSSNLPQNLHPHHEYPEIFKRFLDLKGKEKTKKKVQIDMENSCEFAKCCVQLLSFFKDTYEKVFSFTYPPLHDPCAIYYVISPKSFETHEMFVDVETNSGKCSGRTLCDIHGLRMQKPNAKVCIKMNQVDFWTRFFTCLQMACRASPLNKLKFSK